MDFATPLKISKLDFEYLRGTSYLFFSYTTISVLLIYIYVEFFYRSGL